MGTLKLGNADIPVIVSNFSLHPMDIILINNKSYPLTAESLNEYLSSPEPFKNLDSSPPSKNLSVFGLTDNSAFQSYGSTREGVTYSERPAIKLASFLDTITNVKADDVNDILDTIISEDLKPSFIKNGTDEVFEKLAQLDTTSEEKFAENLLRNIETDRHLVYKDDKGNYFLKQAHSNLDHT